MRRLKLLILGHGRHGKDSAAEYLSYKYGLTFQSSSLAAANALYPMLKTLFGYKSPEEAYKDRHSLRELGNELVYMRTVWAEGINLINLTDKAAMTKLILRENDIYVGMRMKEEVEEARRKELFDAALWIDRSQHLPLEPSSSMTITQDMADIYVDNNSSLQHLHNNLDIVMKAIRSL